MKLPFLRVANPMYRAIISSPRHLEKVYIPTLPTTTMRNLLVGLISRRENHERY